MLRFYEPSLRPLSGWILAGYWLDSASCLSVIRTNGSGGLPRAIIRFPYKSPAVRLPATDGDHPNESDAPGSEKEHVLGAFQGYTLARIGGPETRKLYFRRGSLPEKHSYFG